LKETIINTITGFYFGGVLNWLTGLNPANWEFWVIVVPVAAGFILSSLAED